MAGKQARTRQSSEQAAEDSLRVYAAQQRRREYDERIRALELETRQLERERDARMREFGPPVVSQPARVAQPVSSGWFGALRSAVSSAASRVAEAGRSAANRLVESARVVATTVYEAFAGPQQDYESEEVVRPVPEEVVRPVPELGMLDRFLNTYHSQRELGKYRRTAWHHNVGVEIPDGLTFAAMVNALVNDRYLRPGYSIDVLFEPEDGVDANGRRGRDALTFPVNVPIETGKRFDLIERLRDILEVAEGPEEEETSTPGLIVDELTGSVMLRERGVQVYSVSNYNILFTRAWLYTRAVFIRPQNVAGEASSPVGKAGSSFPMKGFLVHNLTSSDNNCALVPIIRALKLTETPEQLRRKYAIPAGPITPDTVFEIAANLKATVCLCVDSTWKRRVTANGNPEAKTMEEYEQFRAEVDYDDLLVPGSAPFPAKINILWDDVAKHCYWIERRLSACPYSGVALLRDPIPPEKGLIERSLRLELISQGRVKRAATEQKPAETDGHGVPAKKMPHIKATEPPKVSDEKIHYVAFDYETYMSRFGDLHAYAIALLDKDGNQFFKIDPNCTQDALDWLETLTLPKGKTMICLVGYNNSRFDNFILLPELAKRQNLRRCTPHIMVANRTLLKMQWGRYRVLDLCRFTGMSLKDACKGFNIGKDEEKGSFSHRTVQDLQVDHSDGGFWEELRRREGEKIEKYNMQDCRATLGVFFKVQEGLKLALDMNIADYQTLPQMAKKAWERSLKTAGKPVYTTRRDPKTGELKQKIKEGKPVFEPIELWDIRDRELFMLLRSAVNGGRSNPPLEFLHMKSRRGFEEFDATSLYGFVMAACEYPVGEPTFYGPGYRPVGLPLRMVEDAGSGFEPDRPLQRGDEVPRRHSSQLTKDFFEKLSFWVVTIISQPKPEIVPVRPIKGDGVLRYEVPERAYPFTTMLYCEDIRTLLDYGADFWVEPHGLVFENKSNNVYGIVGKWMDMKAAAKVAHNKPLETIYKLLSNSLSGKMAQGIFNNGFELVSGYARYAAFEKEHVGVTVEPVHDMLLVKGARIDEPSKFAPAYLAAAIYSNARSHMYRACLNPLGKSWLNTETDSVYVNLDDEEATAWLTKFQSPHTDNMRDRFGKFTLGGEPGEFKAEFGAVETRYESGCFHIEYPTPHKRCTELIITGKKSYCCANEAGDMIKCRFKGVRTLKPEEPDQEYYDRVAERVNGAGKLVPITPAELRDMDMFERYKLYTECNPITVKTYRRIVKGEQVNFLCNALSRRFDGSDLSGIHLEAVYRIKEINTVGKRALSLPEAPLSRDEEWKRFRDRLDQEIIPDDYLCRNHERWMRHHRNVVIKSWHAKHPIRLLAEKGPSHDPTHRLCAEWGVGEKYLESSSCI